MTVSWWKLSQTWPEVVQNRELGLAPHLAAWFEVVLREGCELALSWHVELYYVQAIARHVLHHGGALAGVYVVADLIRHF